MLGRIQAPSWGILAVNLALGLSVSACGLPPPAIPLSDRALGTADSARIEADFMPAVFDRLVADRQVLSGDDAALPAAVFSAIDNDQDGFISRYEWNRPVEPAAMKAHQLAFRPFASAMFNLASQGRRSVHYADFADTLERHPDRPNFDSRRAFHSKAPSGQMEKSAFESYYMALGTPRAGQTNGASGLLAPYLKFAGFVGSEFLMRRPRKANRLRPSDLGYRFEEASLKSEDGLSIKAWYLPAASPTNQAIVMAHGHGSNRSGWLESKIELAALHNAGYNLVLVELRRHGESSGEWCTMALHEDRDVRAGLNWALAKGNATIGLFGNSLGAATVIHAAATMPQVRAVWDDCAYASVQFAVISAAGMLHLPFIHLVAPAILETAKRRLGEDLSGGDPDVWIGRLGGKPVSIVHGLEDPYILAENSRVNYAAARDPKSLWLVPGAGHGTAALTAPFQYQRRVTDFFERAFAPVVPTFNTLH